MGHKKRGIAVLMCRLTLLNALQMSSASVVEERPMLQKGFNSSWHGELKCLPEVGVSDEEPDIKWTKPEKSTLTTKSWMKNKNIIISDTVRRVDEGNFTCIATYSNGTRISQAFSVCVTLSTSTNTKPERGRISDETYAPEGHSITLECKAAIGTPRCVDPFKYTLTWSKMLLEHGRTEVLTSSDNMDITEPQIIENALLYGRLNIKKVRSSHYGTYFCNITNESGSLVQGVNVTDRVPLKLLRERQLWLVCGVIICITLIPFFMYSLQHSMASISLFFKSLRANPSMTGDGILYDVLIVHGPSSLIWVWKVLVPKLEKQYHYKCYFQDRDMLGGEETICSIANVVEKCKCVMIIVTPCILEDTPSLYAIINAFEARFKQMPSRTMFPVILEPIKDKQGKGNQQKVINIIKQLKSESVKVPVSCGQRRVKKDTYDNQSVKCDDLKSLSEMTLMDPRLLGPHENCTVRSRSKSPKDQKSKSPKDQKLKNMIIGANGGLVTSSPSEDLLEGDGGGKGVVSIKSTEARETERDEGRNKTSHRMPLNFVLKKDVSGDEESPPETPCSTTPMVSYVNSSREGYGNRTCLTKWVRVFLKGDDEQLFWKKLRLHLPLTDVQNKPRE